MLRFICRETDIGAAANVGGPVHTTHKTFTDVAELEDWLKIETQWATRECLGVEVVETQADSKERTLPDDNP
jgi:hypothetical protein